MRSILSGVERGSAESKGSTFCLLTVICEAMKSSFVSTRRKLQRKISNKIEAQNQSYFSSVYVHFEFPVFSKLLKKKEGQVKM